MLFTGTRKIAASAPDGVTGGTISSRMRPGMSFCMRTTSTTGGDHVTQRSKMAPGLASGGRPASSLVAIA